MSNLKPPVFKSHGEEVAWIIAHKDDLLAQAKMCAGCGEAEAVSPCHVCDESHMEGSRYGHMPLPDKFCAECAPKCISCDQPTCEFHVRKSGECMACSGPTDAETHQMLMNAGAI